MVNDNKHGRQFELQSAFATDDWRKTPGKAPVIAPVLCPVSAPVSRNLEVNHEYGWSAIHL
jgi:hypothetical protein